MRITFSPQRRTGTLSVVKAADILTINGEVFDFSGLPDGGSLEDGVVPCEWIVGPVERVGGDLRLRLIVPHGPNPPEAVAFPAPLVNPVDGALNIPKEPAP